MYYLNLCKSSQSINFYSMEGKFLYYLWTHSPSLSMFGVEKPIAKLTRLRLLMPIKLSSHHQSSFITIAWVYTGINIYYYIANS